MCISEDQSDSDAAIELTKNKAKLASLNIDQPESQMTTTQASLAQLSTTEASELKSVPSGEGKNQMGMVDRLKNERK